MAEETDRFKIPYPSRGATNYFDVYQSGMEAIDVAIFSSFSERNTVIHGGGLVTWALAGPSYELTFSEPISYQTPTFGQSQTALAATVDVPPAHFVYADISRGSTSSSTSVVFSASTQVPVDNAASVLAWHNPETHELVFVTGLVLPVGGSSAVGIQPASVTVSTDAESLLGTSICPDAPNNDEVLAYVSSQNVYCPINSGLVKNTIDPPDVLDIPANYQYIVYGSFSLAGTVNLDGDLIIL